VLPPVSLPTKTQLLDAAAYLSLFLSLADTLWPKVVQVADMVGGDVVRWTQRLYAFRRQVFELRSESRTVRSP
jgi:hypothetical protein